MAKKKSGASSAELPTDATANVAANVATVETVATGTTSPDSAATAAESTEGESGSDSEDDDEGTDAGEMTDEQERSIIDIAARRMSYQTGSTIAGCVSMIRHNPTVLAADYHNLPNHEMKADFQRLQDHLTAKKLAAQRAAAEVDPVAETGGDAGK